MAFLFTNNATSTLASGITNVATSLTVQASDGALFPNPTGGDTFRCTLVDSSNNIEIVSVTARSTDTFTIVRGQEGTTGLAFSSGDRVELRLTKEQLEAFPQFNGKVVATADTAAGDNAAMGYTATEGLILTGQGSVNDVTIKNDADADVITIPTGTTNVGIAGKVILGGDTSAGDIAAAGYTATEGLILTGQGSTNDVTIKNDADADVITIPTGTTGVTFAGGITTNGNIVFPATQNPSANANTLDDYEEGTFTVTLTASSGTITLVSGQDSLAYTKIGRVVYVSGRLAVDSVSSPIGILTLNGLPFTTGSPGESAGEIATPILCSGLNALADGYNSLIIRQTSTGVTTLQILDTAFTNTADEIVATTDLWFNFFYFASN